MCFIPIRLQESNISKDLGSKFGELLILPVTVLCTDGSMINDLAGERKMKRRPGAQGTRGHISGSCAPLGQAEAGRTQDREDAPSGQPEPCRSGPAPRAFRPLRTGSCGSYCGSRLQGCRAGHRQCSCPSWCRPVSGTEWRAREQGLHRINSSH